MRKLSLTPHDHFLLMQTEEIADQARACYGTLSHMYWGSDGWAGGGDTSSMLSGIVRGDESRVAASEKYLASIEDQIPISRGWRNVDDVVGAVPNVPAFLAGHPQHMRRRQRTARDNAPLAIYMDLTSSCSIDQSRVEKRGLVLLALTRMLVEHRAVELWVGTSTGECGLSSTVAWRIDTAPLDLARAAYHIAAVPMSRRFGYGVTVSEHFKNRRWNGEWAFGNYSEHSSTMRRRITSVFSDMEMLYVPAIHATDPMTDNPVGWLRQTLSQYVQQEE